MTNIESLRSSVIIVNSFCQRSELDFHYRGYLNDLIEYLEVSIFENAFEGKINIKQLAKRWKVEDRSVYEILNLLEVKKVIEKITNRYVKQIIAIRIL